MGNLLWEVRLSIGDAEKMFITDNFWTDLFKCWCKHSMGLGEAPLLDQIIWYNSSIRIADKPVFYETWWNKGITYVSQLYKESGEIKSLQEINLEFDINIPFTKYHGLIRAIKHTQKNENQIES